MGPPKLSLLSLLGPFACVYEVKPKSKVDTQVVTEGLSVDTQVVTLEVDSPKAGGAEKITGDNLGDNKKPSR